MQRIKIFTQIYSVDVLQKEIDDWFDAHPNVIVEKMDHRCSESGSIRIAILYSFEKPKVKVVKTCNLCGGSGRHTFTNIITRQPNSSVCPVCAGTGEIVTWVEQETEE